VYEMNIVYENMGRKRLGDEPTVLTTVRIPGEWATKLTAGGLTMAEVIRGLVEREYLALQKILDTAVEVKKSNLPRARSTKRNHVNVPPPSSDVPTCPNGHPIKQYGKCGKWGCEYYEFAR
jgi:hypothetical protein